MRRWPAGDGRRAMAAGRGLRRPGPRHRGARARSWPTSRRCCRSGWARWSASSTAIGSTPSLRADGRRRLRLGVIERDRSLPLRVLFGAHRRGLAAWAERIATLDRGRAGARAAPIPTLGEMPAAGDPRTVRARPRRGPHRPARRTSSPTRGRLSRAAVFILLAVPIGIVLGLLIGGRLERLSEICASTGRGWPLLGLAGPDRSSSRTPLGGVVGARGPAIYVASTALVLIAVLRNLRDPGLGWSRSARLQPRGDRGQRRRDADRRRRPWPRPARAVDGFSNSAVLEIPRCGR